MSNTSIQLNTQARTVQLCRWTYAEVPNADKVEIFVHVEPATIGQGYGLVITYHAHAFEFLRMDADSHGNPKEIWIIRHVEQFLTVNQACVQAQVASGLDPLLELFKADKAFQEMFATTFPRLATKYEALAINSTLPAPVAVKVWKTL